METGHKGVTTSLPQHDITNHNADWHVSIGNMAIYLWWCWFLGLLVKESVRQEAPSLISHAPMLMQDWCVTINTGAVVQHTNIVKVHSVGTGHQWSLTQHLLVVEVVTWACSWLLPPDSVWGLVTVTSSILFIHIGNSYHCAAELVVYKM